MTTLLHPYPCELALVRATTSFTDSLTIYFLLNLLSRSQKFQSLLLASVFLLTAKNQLFSDLLQVTYYKLKMAEMFAPAPEPKTELGRYRIMSSTAGIRVSPLQIGAMSFGDAWKDFMGSMDKKSTFELLDAFVDAGGNFIDTGKRHRPTDIQTTFTDANFQPTTTRTSSPRNGSASGWQNARTET